MSSDHKKAFRGSTPVWNNVCGPSMIDNKKQGVTSGASGSPTRKGVP